VNSQQSATSMALGLGLIALVIFIGYIVWISLKF
jgi:hypothetical protein